MSVRSGFLSGPYGIAETRGYRDNRGDGERESRGRLAQWTPWGFSPVLVCGVVVTGLLWFECGPSMWWSSAVECVGPSGMAELLARTAEATQRKSARLI